MCGIERFWLRLVAARHQCAHHSHIGRAFEDAGAGRASGRDADGWFYLVDRKKDMIVASGFKVWPREVEDTLLRHPAVREAAAVGVPDEYRGETVRAYVSLRPGTATTPGELIVFCREQLAAYKYPRRVVVLPDLPKTPTGKLLRRQLREHARDSAGYK